MGSAPQPTPNPWQRSAAEDLWERTLKQIPSALGRIIYLSRLRDPATDRYEHYGLSTVFGEEEAEAAIRQSHQAVLASWIDMSIVDQLKDLDQYLDTLPQSRRRILASWIRNDSFTQFLPPTVTHAQLVAYVTSFRLMVKALMRAAASGAETSPNS